MFPFDYAESSFCAESFMLRSYMAENYYDTKTVCKRPPELGLSVLRLLEHGPTDDINHLCWRSAGVRWILRNCEHRRQREPRNNMTYDYLYVLRVCVWGGGGGAMQNTDRKNQINHFSK
jgi:hypothetical protein